MIVDAIADWVKPRLGAIADWVKPQLKMLVAGATFALARWLQSDFGIEFDSEAVTVAAQSIVTGFLTWLVPNIEKAIGGGDE